MDSGHQLRRGYPMQSNACLTALCWLLLSLSTCEAGIASTHELSLDWEEGDYWVVKSPRWLHGVGMNGAGSYAKRKHDRDYYTRYWVQSVESGLGGKVATVKIHTKVDDLYEWSDEDDYDVIRVNISTGCLLEASWHLRDAKGEEKISRVLYLPCSGANVAPRHWPHANSAIPESHYFIWPVFERNPKNGNLVLSSRIYDGDDPADYYEQAVTLTSGGARVEYSGMQGDEIPLSFRFSPGLPWYEVYLVDGKIINEVVETGNVAPCEGQVRLRDQKPVGSEMGAVEAGAWKEGDTPHGCGCGGDDATGSPRAR